MILFAIIGEDLGVIESATVTSATIVGMLIVCWAIYTVYTGESCNLYEKKNNGFLYSIAICGIWSRNRRSVIHDRFCHLGLVGFGIGYFRRRVLVFHIKRRGKRRWLLL